MLREVLTCIASFFLIRIFHKIFHFIYSKMRSHQVWEHLENRHVLITDANSPAGRALALKFAGRGLRLVLLGRDEDGLVELSNTINKQVDCTYHVISYIKPGNLAFLDEYDIGILVNCTDSSDEHPGYFVEQPVEEVVHINLLTPMLITKKVLVNMMACKYGYVLNMGSFVDRMPCPLYSAYGAAKEAFRSWSNSLYYELLQYNVKVEWIYTGLGAPKEGKASKHGFFAVTADEFADSLIKTFGSSRTSVLSHRHLLQYLFLTCLPYPILGRVILNKNTKVMNRKKEIDASYRYRKNH
jgi:17beta-estradiol 17-dehydrogenase / very-long-chain 3-oxoacyl-CoA reductase